MTGNRHGDRRRRGEELAFLRVRLTGTFLGEQTKPMIATFGGGPGFELVTPFLSADGLAVLVDRGTVPAPLEARWQAREAADLVASLGPAFIKAGQALSTRPDIVPPLLLCYFIPGIFNSLGVIDGAGSQLYNPVASRVLRSLWCRKFSV